MTSTGFLTACAWLDADGYHVWQAHDCAKGRVSSMLPFPEWRAVGERVEPSVICSDCGLHAFLTIGESETA